MRNRADSLPEGCPRTHPGLCHRDTLEQSAPTLARAVDHGQRTPDGRVAEIGIADPGGSEIVLRGGSGCYHGPMREVHNLDPRKAFAAWTRKQTILARGKEFLESNGIVTDSHPAHLLAAHYMINYPNSSVGRFCDTVKRIHLFCSQVNYENKIRDIIKSDELQVRITDGMNDLHDLEYFINQSAEIATERTKAANFLDLCHKLYEQILHPYLCALWAVASNKTFGAGLRKDIASLVQTPNLKKMLHSDYVSSIDELKVARNISAHGKFTSKPDGIVGIDTGHSKQTINYESFSSTLQIISELWQALIVAFLILGHRLVDLSMHPNMLAFQGTKTISSVLGWSNVQVDITSDEVVVQAVTASKRVHIVDIWHLAGIFVNQIEDKRNLRLLITLGDQSQCEICIPLDLVDACDKAYRDDYSCLHLASMIIVKGIPLWGPDVLRQKIAVYVYQLASSFETSTSKPFLSIKARIERWKDMSIAYQDDVLTDAIRAAINWIQNHHSPLQLKQVGSLKPIKTIAETSVREKHTECIEWN